MKKENPSKKRRRNDAEFKTNILKMNADGRSVSSLSESFGINENLIYYELILDKSRPNEAVLKNVLGDK